tara:strand:+ start:12608 stop:13285 length:678 start_codon:yes stop_codon:yes gene_type:complete
MALLLALETATRNCSVALFENENQIQLKEYVSDKYSHSEQLILFIEQVLKDANILLDNLDVIALGKGPGSYTGLRIGTSTAKGLCYSLGIPLISISTLKSMAFSITKEKNYKFYCPMIDARRMEVFAAIYNNNNQMVRDIKAEVVDKYTYSDFLQEKILFFGDGASKCQLTINNDNAFFLDNIFPSAKDIGKLAYKKFINKDFEDIAYYEPYYLKDFIAGGKNNV